MPNNYPLLVKILIYSGPETSGALLQFLDQDNLLILKASTEEQIQSYLSFHTISLMITDDALRLEFLLENSAFERVLFLGHSGVLTEEFMRKWGERTDFIPWPIQKEHLLNKVHFYIDYQRMWNLLDSKAFDLERNDTLTDQQLLEGPTREGLELLIRNGPIFNYSCDRDLRYTWHGNSKDAFIPLHMVLGRTDAELFPPESMKEFTAFKRKIIATGERISQEFPFPIRGSTYYFQVMAGPVRNAQGEIIGLTAAGLDVTERRLAENALRKSEHFNKQIIEHSADCIKVLDLNGNLSFMSRGGQKLLGIKDMALYLNMFWSDLFPLAEDKELAIQAITKAKAGQLARFRGRGPEDHTKELHTRWWDNVLSPIRDCNGDVESILCISRDVTEECYKEEALRVADRRKDEFLAMVSHELRTPLNVILGNAELLIEDLRDLQFDLRPLEVIYRNAQIQSQLINDLLDISRITSGKLLLERVYFKPQEIIDEVLVSLRPASEVKNIEVTSLPPTSTVTLFGDSGRFQQILWNLLSNAVKFTTPGGKVWIETHLRGEFVEFRVNDTGIGISEDFLPYVFERFRQEDGTMTRRYGGLGLGLSIARYLIELHGGSIEAQSLGLGKGAEFKFHLPLPSEKLLATEPQFEDFLI